MSDLPPGQDPAFTSPPPVAVPLSAADTPTKQLFDRITAETSKVFVGQDELVLGTLVALFSSGHILIESVPGLGKTLFVRTLGRVLGCRFGRIQFTPDLMPADIIGTNIVMEDQSTGKRKRRQKSPFKLVINNGCNK